MLKYGLKFVLIRISKVAFDLAIDLTIQKSDIRDLHSFRLGDYRMDNCHHFLVHFASYHWLQLTHYDAKALGIWMGNDYWRRREQQ